MFPLAPGRRAPYIGTLLAAALLLALAAQARAADSVYWANYGSNSISYASLAGGGGGNLEISGADGTEPNGIAIDAAAGRVYWISTTGKISYANLSGGGGGVLNTAGASPGFAISLAIDPATRRLYWGNAEANKVSYANLDGSGGGDLDTTGATVDRPTGVAVDQASGRLYWGNGSGADKFSYASLSGGNGGTVPTAATPGEIDGIAIDSAAGRIYWADYPANKISYANLDGSGVTDLATTGATVNGPFGVAVDAASGRVYWANESGNSISYANLDGSGGADLNTVGTSISGPAFPVLLKAPSATAAPTLTGGSKPDSILSCVAATWAPDLLGSFLYRAPQTASTQWLKDGQPLTWAIAPTLAAKAVGSYSCQGGAANHAGSARTPASNSVAVFRLARNAKSNRKRGTATLAVKVPGAGTLTLTGKQLIGQKRIREAGSTGTVKLPVKAKGKAKKRLVRTGKIWLKARVSFTPALGAATIQKQSLLVKKKLNR